MKNMDVSENNVSNLINWKQDIEELLKYGLLKWEDIYPLYSQIVFWIAFKNKHRELKKVS